MAIRHIAIGKESTSGTWEAPTKAYPLTNWTQSSGQEYTDLRNTGSGYGLADAWRGAYAPSGSASMRMYENWLGTLLRGAGFNRITSTVIGATTAYGHGCLPQESQANVSLSIQAIADPSNGISYRGVFINKMKFACKAKEPGVIDFDWIALDEGLPGGNWGDGTSAPAIISSLTYYGASVGVLHFAGCTVTYNATPTLNTTTNQFSISGGSVITKADMAEINLENNYEYSHTLGSIYYPAVITRKERAVTGKLDIDFNTVDTTYYSAMKAGTEVCLEFKWLGGAVDGSVYSLIMTLPKVTLRQADLPDLSGDQARRMQSVNFTAQVHPSMVDSGGQAYDIGIKLIDDQTSY